MNKIKCACGCNKLLEKYDKSGRPRRFINGHNNRKYNDPNGYRKEWVKRNRPKVNKNRRRKNHERKIHLMQETTNMHCSECGIEYNGKNGSIFHFHHIDPSIKKFPLSHCLSYSYEKSLNEAKKCKLLCSNCHTLLHQEEY